MDITPTIRTRYRAYLQTDEWRARRNRALKAAFFRCTTCGSKRGLQVHHRTYERLGCEWDEDLQVLCDGCHEGHHVQQMYESPYRVYLKLAAEVLAENTFASIADLSAEMKARCVKLKMRYDDHQIDRALGFVCGSSKYVPLTPETPEAEAAVQGRSLNHRESKELLRRIGFDALIKTIPSQPSTIDIYGRIPREDEGDHDRY